LHERKRALENAVARRYAALLRLGPQSDRGGETLTVVRSWASQGTGKEYIGDDATSMAEAVQQALRQCALQLKSKLARAQAVKDRKERKKVLYRYIPDVTRAIFGVLNDAVDRGRTTAASVAAAKRLRGDPEPAEPVDEVRPSATALRMPQPTIKAVHLLECWSHRVAVLSAHGHTEARYLIPRGGIDPRGPEARTKSTYGIGNPGVLRNECGGMGGLAQDEYVLEKVKRGRVTEEVLAAKLTTYIDAMDHDQALDLAMKIGVSKQAVFLGTRQEQGALKLELHTPCCVLQMLQ
jgi:hypothetical protein